MSNSVWAAAGRLLASHLASGERLDFLLEKLPRGWAPVERRRCRRLVLGAVRHRGLLEDVVGAHLRQEPREIVRAALLLAGFELWEDAAAAPVIVHHAVEIVRELASPGEARLVNAVLRRVGPELQRIESEEEPGDVAGLARRYSHPEWLVARWERNFGLETTRALLKWDQQPAPVYARVVRRPKGSGQDEETWPEFFHDTRWPGFFLLEKPAWEVVERLLAEGRIYLQDPATALAPQLVAAAPGERVLDLCAAPGGKSLQIAEAVGSGGDGQVVAVDLPGARSRRLRQNLERYGFRNAVAFPADASRLEAAALAAAGLPSAYDAVLLDVPCSNTGVLRHRVDVKWRLKPEELAQLALLQRRLLERAARLLRPGGRLVYSTCSLEPEENAGVVEDFLAAHAAEFALESTAHSHPAESGCDGAGVFRLRNLRSG